MGLLCSYYTISQCAVDRIWNLLLNDHGFPCGSGAVRKWQAMYGVVFIMAQGQV
jgi:hypothetical protein